MMKEANRHGRLMFSKTIWHKRIQELATLKHALGRRNGYGIGLQAKHGGKESLLYFIV
jgi:hypothetical protein